MSSGVPLSGLKNKYLNGFKIFEATLNGSATGDIHNLRTKAIDAFNELGFPTTKNEEWKYTNLSKFIEESKYLDETHQDSNADLSKIVATHIPASFEANTLVFCDGKYQEDLSLVMQDEEGVVVVSFANALKKHKDVVCRYIGKAVPPETNGLTALNTAFASEGAFIHVLKNVTAKYPVHLLFLSGAGGEGSVNNTRNLIIIEEGASLNLVETYASVSGSEYFSNTVSEVFVEKSAIFNHYRFQVEDEKTANHINFTGINQQNNSLVTNMTITLGGKLVRNDLNYRLDGTNCESHMFGLYIGSGTQHIDNHTLVDHAQPHCFSNEAYKGIMAGKGTGVFNGKVIVRPDAQKTNAYQSNKNILLSDEAHINTKPQLEIFANDVKCSHGATTGQLDEEALFYLQSRGIGKAAAKAMLTYAFAADILENIKIQPLKEYAVKLVTDKLNSLAHSPFTDSIDQQ
jgi:Fe-S cluster assembly protein SufD